VCISIYNEFSLLAAINALLEILLAKYPGLVKGDIPKYCKSGSLYILIYGNIVNIRDFSPFVDSFRDRTVTINPRLLKLQITEKQVCAFGQAENTQTVEVSPSEMWALLIHARSSLSSTS